MKESVAAKLQFAQGWLALILRFKAFPFLIKQTLRNGTLVDLVENPAKLGRIGHLEHSLPVLIALGLAEPTVSA